MEETTTAATTVPEKQIFSATGRRKESSARVKVHTEGKGSFTINGRDANAYFVTIDQKIQIKRPVIAADLDGKVDVAVNVIGGGLSGQAGAVSLGIARALIAWNPALRATLRKENLLTRDPRAKERKKYGRRGARRRVQWTKR